MLVNVGNVTKIFSREVVMKVGISGTQVNMADRLQFFKNIYHLELACEISEKNLTKSKDEIWCVTVISDLNQNRSFRRLPRKTG